MGKGIFLNGTCCLIPNLLPIVAVGIVIMIVLGFISPQHQYNSSVEYNNEDKNSNYCYKPIEDEENKIK